MINYPTLRLKRLVKISFLVINAFIQPIFAENTSPNTHHEEQKEGHIHHAHANEIGMSAGYVYLTPEDDSAFGLHLHFIRRLQGESFKKYLGLGVGFETIFAEHLHYNVMGSIAIYPYHNLAIVLSPGLLIVEHHKELETRYSTHLESVYGFLFGGYEVGPVVGLARSDGDMHYTIGIHFGKGF